MKKKNKSLIQNIIKFISSKKFFSIILILVAFQGLWFATTHRPSIYDERFHYDYISLYTEQYSPFISEQDPKWDIIGDATRNPSYLFFYLMSWPLRIIQAATDNYMIKVISLRVIFLGFFLGGLIFFKRLLEHIGSSKATSNAVILFIALIPAFAPFSGVISYDNLVFFLTPIFFLLLLKSLDKNCKTTDILNLVSLSIFISLVKFPALPLVVPAMMLFLVIKLRRHGLSWFRNIYNDIKKNIRTFPMILSLLTVILFTGLFLERPIKNLIEYKSPTPECYSIISEERCSKNYTAARNIEFLDKKSSNFKPIDPFNYLLTYWLPGVIKTEYRVAPTVKVPAMVPFAFGVTLLGITLVLIYLREILKNNIRLTAIVGICFAYTVLLILYNYHMYLTFGQPIAIKIRYLLFVLPIFVYLLAESISVVIKYVSKNRQIQSVIKLIILVFGVGVAMVGGGGVSSMALSANQVEWNNKHSIYINNKTEYIINRLMIIK